MANWMQSGSISFPENNSNSLGQTQGSTIKSVYVERKMKVYAIHKQELHNLGFLNTGSLIFFSGASFLLSIVCRDGFERADFTSPAFYSAIVAFAFGGYTLWARSNIIEEIKNDSVEHEKS